VVAPEVGAVANDSVIAIGRMSDEPSAAIVDVNVDFGVVKERLDHRGVRNELQIAGVNLYNVERFNLRMIGEDLSPGARGEANHENALGRGMNSAEDERAKDEVGIVTWIDQEEAIVHAAAENGVFLGHGDYPVPIFDLTGERCACFGPLAEG